MQPHETATNNMPAPIREARQVYKTEPMAAALMLHDGISGLKRTSAPRIDVQGSHQEELPHGESVLRAALWTLDIMGEDARAGIALTPSEWDLNISVAESVVRMLETANDPT